ncbi:hypothetical protein Q069_00061 [Pseudomonas aeruginosa BL15]|uniref:hypothetical protein n=1 Tax=Pseudomonas aeruginosa TaxID=287 RepID=UPI0003B93C02|nr:hypothetical protein [Pseudomonas aeruginosa]ERV37562.1 hypothetical protein Q069_00061 [Pseudomonas aeruginosa BL15]
MNSRYGRRKSRATINPNKSSSPEKNLARQIELARGQAVLLGEEVEWGNSTWLLSAGLFKKRGQNTRSVRLDFTYPVCLSCGALPKDWEDVAKVMVVRREVEQHKSVSSHRTFLTVFGFVCNAANGRPFEMVTREVLDSAALAISKSSSSESEVYKRLNLMHEIVNRCSEYGLCKAYLSDYRYASMKRPDSHGGRSAIRLDDPAVNDEKPSRVLALSTYQTLGALIRAVPIAHKYRIYLLVITLLVCTGRRLTEITLLPRQRLEVDSNGAYFKYLVLKGQRGSMQYVMKRVPLISHVVPLVESVLEEVEQNRAECYAVAEEMCRINGPDLRFLSDVDPDEPLYYDRLLEMGMPSNMFDGSGCFGKICEMRAGRRAVFKDDVINYCASHFDPVFVAPLYLADGKEYYLKDMLLLNYRGTSSGHYARWVVNTVTAISFSNFLKKIHRFADEYAGASLTDRFTSHDFRHTLNDALDKGNLPDLMQSEFFGRKNQRDTVSYQHTTPEQKALKIREKIKLGQAGGFIAERAMRVPVERRDAFLKSAVRAVHDLGNGHCVHLWSQGGCPRHLDCDTGCEKYIYVIPNDDGEEAGASDSIIREIKHQMAHSFFTLFVAVSDGVSIHGPWQKHIYSKLHLQQMQLAKMGVSFEDEDIEDFISTGQLDGVAFEEIKEGVRVGYSHYIENRVKFHEYVLELYGALPEVCYRDKSEVKYIPVKEVSNEVSEDE